MGFKLYSKLFILSCLVSLVSLSSLAQTELPERSDFRFCKSSLAIGELKSGEIVDLPLCFQDADYFSLIASIEMEQAIEILAGTGLYPVDFNGKAMLNIAALKYGMSTIGSYSEFLVTMIVSEKPDQKNGWWKFFEYFGGTPPKGHGVHVIKLWVDQDLALRVGNELWGFNKDFAVMDFAVKPRSSSKIVVNNEYGQPMIEINSNQGFPLWIPFGQYMAFKVNPADSDLWLNTRFRGNVWYAKFTDDDELKFFDESTFWGRKLASWNIQPLFMLQGTGIKNQFAY